MEPRDFSKVVLGPAGSIGLIINIMHVEPDNFALTLVHRTSEFSHATYVLTQLSSIEYLSILRLVRGEMATAFVTPLPFPVKINWLDGLVTYLFSHNPHGERMTNDTHSVEVELRDSNTSLPVFVVRFYDSGKGKITTMFIDRDNRQDIPLIKTLTAGLQRVMHVDCVDGFIDSYKPQMFCFSPF